VRRVESVEAVAIAGRNAEAARRLGAGFSIATITTDYREVLRDPGIDAVHICTPNAQHFLMAKDALQAGKSVLCEKPLATTVEEGEELVALALRQGVRNCVCHNLRYYPMVQQMRCLREAGDLGEILVVQGTYSQDWLLYETDWNWRVDAKAGGPSRCMADIGSHWFDMAEHITGLRVTSLCADLQTFHSTRRRPKHSVETFANTMLGPEDYIETSVDTEDFGAVIFRMGTRTRGSVTGSALRSTERNLRSRGTRSVRTNSGQGTAMPATRSSLRIRPCSCPRLAATPIFRAATAKGTTTHSSSSSGASMLRLEIRTPHLSIRSSSTDCGN
jgi:predicted dehydrogenase